MFNLFCHSLTHSACSGNTDCSGSPLSGSSSDGLSDGSIFLIVLFVVFALYWIVGYSVMALTVNKDGGFKDYRNNIPQRGFWMACPKLVGAGCAVSKERTMGMIARITNKDAASDLSEAVISDE